MPAQLPYPPPFMDLATLSEHICVGESTIESWVKLGQFPAPRKIGGKRLWQWKEVERHLAPATGTVAASPAQQAMDITNATRRAVASRHN
jgi:predicted DNA-binding transcriptional regulator AlpA